MRNLYITTRRMLFSAAIQMIAKNIFELTDMTPSEVRTEGAELEAVAEAQFTPRRRGTRRRAFFIIVFAILFWLELLRVSIGAVLYKLDIDCLDFFCCVVME